MSRIVLQTILLYRGDAQHAPVEKELPLSGIEKLFLGINFPKKGQTFLYGNRSPAIPYFRERAEELGLDSAVVDINVEIGAWFRKKTELLNLQDPDPETRANFLSVARANRDVTDLMQRKWFDELGPDRALEDDWPKSPTSYPYIMDSVIGLKDFEHLYVIAYTIKTGELGELQVATLFNLDQIKLVDGGNRLVDTEIYIP